MQAILSNAQHPEYGEVTIPFPIGENEYGRCLELLGKMEDVYKRQRQSRCSSYAQTPASARSCPLGGRRA